MPLPRWTGFVAAAALSTAVACASGSQRRSAQPSDANLLAMLMAANNADISYARLTAARAQSPAVHAFAQRMLADHGALNQLATDLISRVGITPRDNAASLDLRDESGNRRDILRELSGPAFDSAYVANEIDYHTRLLATLDRVMITAARHPELRRLVTGIRPAVAAHLEHARRLQAELGVTR